MHSAFVALLFGGALATALFAVLGLTGGVHGGGHASHGHASHGHGAGHAGHGHLGSHGVTSRLAASAGWALSWISPLTLAAGALWFGGVGLLAEPYAGAATIVAALAGALIGVFIVRGLLTALVRASTPPLHQTSDGALATVNATIRADAPGEVLYTLEGLHRSAPARSLDGSEIPRGTTVVVVRREGGFAWVTPLDPLASLGPETRPAPRDNGQAASIRKEVGIDE